MDNIRILPLRGPPIRTSAHFLICTYLYYMHVFKRACFICFLFIINTDVIAQQFGGNPPSLKWRQINTDTVRVIFPDGLQNLAREIAGISHQLGSTQATLGNRLRKISIVLQNQTTVSNAYVGLGPYRSEFFMTPQQNSFELGSLPWYEQLVLHEYRHVQQFNNFRKGLSGFFYILAGELGVSFANSAAIPNWFWEGDAVYQETKMSRQGRGRLPYFFNGYHSLWAAQKKYSWMKLRNGSLRDYVPDHYQLGYLLTAYGREKYGDSIWAMVTNDAVRFKGLFYPFQSAIKRNTGKKYNEFRSEAFDFYKPPLAAKEDSSAAWAGQQKHFSADVEFPQWIDDERLVFVKSNYQKIPAFYVKDVQTGAEEKVRTKDISPDNYFSYRNHRIVYAAYDVDERWGWRDYSELRVLDIFDGWQRTLTKRSKYFAPDISSDGRQVVAVQVLPDGKCTLHVLDGASGTLVKAIPNPDELFYTHPKFYGKQKIISAVRNKKGEMALGVFDIKNNTADWLVPFSINVIGYPNVQGDTISFTASSGGQDELFAIINRKIYRFEPLIKNRATGNYQLNIRNNKMAWVSFTAAGYRLVQQNGNSDSFKEISADELQPALPVYGINALRKQEKTITGNASSIDQPAEHYSKAFRLLHFHSWLPNISDPDYTLSFISENVLNTLQAGLYFNYNTNEKSKKVGFTGAYGALYPWIRLGSAYTKDRSFNYGGNRVIWNEWEARAGVLVPLNLTQGRNYNSLRIGTDYVYVKPDYKGTYKDTFDNRGYGYINSYLTFSSQVQKARQHIYPRFAQTLRLDYNHAVTSIEGNQFLANGLLYFPGILVNHNLVLNAAFHRRDTIREILFTNSFPFSRGYTERNFHQMYKLGANYHLPLWYPDWGLGNIVYFLRVRGNAFFDYTHIVEYNNSRQKVSLDYRSYGTEIFFDTKWWNQQPVSFGFRYSRLMDGAQQGLGPNQFEFILPVNLINR